MKSFDFNLADNDFEIKELIITLKYIEKKLNKVETMEEVDLFTKMYKIVQEEYFEKMQKYTR